VDILQTAQGHVNAKASYKEKCACHVKNLAMSGTVPHVKSAPKTVTSVIQRARA